MASYSGRFISNIKKDQYNVSGPNKCMLRDDKFTYNQVKKHNKADNCLISVNGSVYDIDKYKSDIKEQNENADIPDDKKLDRVFLDLKCGKNYQIIKEKNIFQLKSIKSSYNENWSYLKNLFYKFKNRYILHSTQEEKDRLELLNLEELKKELNNKDIKYFDEETPNLEDLRNRLLKNYNIRKNNRIYVLASKLFIITTLLTIYFINKNPIVLYILISLIIYEIFINIKYLFFDISYERDCVNLGSHINVDYSQYKVGTIVNYYMYKLAFYTILLVFILFLGVYYYKSKNHYVILTVFLIIMYNLITNYKQFKIKNRVVADIQDEINNTEVN